MSFVDTRDRTFQVKVVYYGPGLSGKTTNLEMLSRLLNPERRGDLMVLDTVGDRTLFFDWMPVELGKIRGFDVKIQLFTVPGQVRYNATRKRVLEGVDGLVFVVDSQAEALEQNVFSLENLRENLEELGMQFSRIPMVVQYNKRDLPSALPIEEVAEHLGLEKYPYVESVASEGTGVLETLRLIVRLTLQAVKEEFDPARAAARRDQTAMDGEKLLEEIMRGEQEPEESEPGAIGREAEEKPGAIEGRLAALEESISELRQRVDELAESSGAAEQVLDLTARLDVVQRVVSSLGGKVAALERRTGRLEHATPGHAEYLRRLAGALGELGQVFAEYAERLGGSASRGEREGGGGS